MKQCILEKKNGCHLSVKSASHLFLLGLFMSSDWFKKLSPFFSQSAENQSQSQLARKRFQALRAGDMYLLLQPRSQGFYVRNVKRPGNDIVAFSFDWFTSKFFD